MTRSFVELPIFQSKWKSLGLNDEDLKRLQINFYPIQIARAKMKYIGGVRKMRFAFQNRGKSGSVCYIC